jgi:hypothetical protein
MYSYKIIESTHTSQIYFNDDLIDEKSPWESVSAAQNWAELMVFELNLGIDLTRFNNEN